MTVLNYNDDNLFLSKVSNCTSLLLIRVPEIMPSVCRFFEILRYQKGIVVELIDRRTGEVLIESKEKIRPQECHTKKIDEIPIILSDVELYRIFFVLM